MGNRRVNRVARLSGSISSAERLRNDRAMRWVAGGKAACAVAPSQLDWSDRAGD